MSLMRLLGFNTLPCGCVTGRYREVPTRREVVYVEEKGPSCAHAAHRRNQPLRVGVTPSSVSAPPPRIARVS